MEELAMSFKDKFKNLLTPIDGEDYLELSGEEVESLSDYEKPKGKSVSGIPTNAKMVLFEPRSFEESEDVGRYLKDKRAAVVNLHRLQRDYAQRTIDFLTGVVFAIDGSIQKIGHNVILCTPNTIGVEGEISMNIEEIDS